ncbi:hypothetical protein [Botrimarina hoheduenensis]|uniref:hypothetical protein n=1 Tax=Botrimarina hoheduenensis TaxID=2528000 RepID=UPI0011B69337|nr:hypothetical protein [Botrimarina hoheduenensis]
MIYANHAFPYDHNAQRDSGEDRRLSTSARSRSSRALRKRSRKRSGSAPDCGISARRNRHWAW